MRVAAYLRVSTDRQAELGLGLDVQEQAVRAWARSNGHRISLWAKDEGRSGSEGVENRRGLLDALNAIADRRASGLVVYRLDRLARDLVLQEQLLAEVWHAGGRVWSTSATEDAYLEPLEADADPSRALVRQILGAVSQYERAMIRLRMRSGKARKRESGGFIGGQVPFGYRTDGGRLVPDADEQAALARMTELRDEGASYRAIADALTESGFSPKRSARWHAETVRKILAADARV